MRPRPTKLNNERLAQLAAAKLRALVNEHHNIESAEVTRLGGGASCLVSIEGADSSGWVYFPTYSPGVLGTALIWAKATDCTEINLITDEGGEALAFAASAFTEPTPAIWQSVDRNIVRVQPVAPTIPPPPDCGELAAELAAAGLDVVADHGVWLGEINGLEIARVGERDGECSIDIGVGAYDQFASAALKPKDRDIADALATVLSMVQPHRVAGAEPHAIGRLVRSRWLRAQLVANPETIGLASLNPIPLLIERPGLLETQPAAALGTKSNGSTVLVACTVGLDLGIAETAAGLAALHQPDEILVVVPPRDEHQRIVDAVASLAFPSSVVTIAGEWAS